MLKSCFVAQLLTLVEVNKFSRFQFTVLFACVCIVQLCFLQFTHSVIGQFRLVLLRLRLASVIKLEYRLFWANNLFSRTTFILVHNELKLLCVHGQRSLEVTNMPGTSKVLIFFVIFPIVIDLLIQFVTLYFLCFLFCLKKVPCPKLSPFLSA